MIAAEHHLNRRFTSKLSHVHSERSPCEVCVSVAYMARGNELHKFSCHCCLLAKVSEPLQHWHGLIFKKVSPEDSTSPMVRCICPPTHRDIAGSSRNFCKGCGHCLCAIATVMAFSSLSWSIQIKLEGRAIEQQCSIVTVCSRCARGKTAVNLQLNIAGDFRSKI